MPCLINSRKWRVWNKDITELKSKSEELAFLLEKAAEKARMLCVIKDVIKVDSTYLTGENLNEIIEFYSVKLSTQKGRNDFLNDSDGFRIYCDSADEDYTLNVIAGLEIAFFYKEKMKANDEMKNFPKNYDDYFMLDITSRFAREFLMPRSGFEDAIIKYSEGGECNVTEAANEYKINELAVLSRGKELHLFK